MGSNLGRLTTLGLLAGLAAGAYVWTQQTPQGRRTLEQVQRQLQRGWMPRLELERPSGWMPFGLRRPRGWMPSFMETVAEGTRDFLERGSEVAARQYGMAQPAMRVVGERLGEMGSTLGMGAVQVARGLGETAQRRALPAVAGWLGMRREEELEDITGERRWWQPIFRPRVPTPIIVMPTVGFGVFTAWLGRLALGLFQTVLTTGLWIVAAAAFIILVYRPEQFRLDTLGRVFSTAFESTWQSMRWLMDQLGTAAGTVTRQTEYGRRAA
ncbi:MAG: hypothetical protein HY331_06360 [Chloroflexi bacterium]|nr:hypothetical protein [Chloroflexota bacterium]